MRPSLHLVSAVPLPVGRLLPLQELAHEGRGRFLVVEAIEQHDVAVNVSLEKRS